MRRLADFRIDHGEVELVLQVLLEGLGRDDGVVDALAALLILGGPRGSLAFENVAVAPVVVGLVHVFERVRLIRIRAFLVEGEDFRDVLEHRIRLQRLLDELGEFKRPGLEDFQTLAHLWRKGLLLG